MVHFPGVKRQQLRYLFYLAGIGIMFFNVLFIFKPAIAHAQILVKGQHTSSNCSRPGPPTSQSLLVALLDRSSSLFGSDPQQYSTSVTKILADLWPGTMDAVLFNGQGKNLVNETRQQLKDDLESNRFVLHGLTPLAAAIGTGFGFIQSRGFPSGSRVFLITDGDPAPDPTGQANEILTRWVPQYCQKGIPINAFGLNINNATDPHANALLKDVTEQTGGSAFQTYQNVTNPADLGQAVIGLYNTWGGLPLKPATLQNGNYGVHVDNFAKELDFLTFRANGEQVTLQGPGSNPISSSSALQTNDVHYEFDSVILPSISPSGDYSVRVAGNPKDVAVYTLEKSRLQITIVSPSPQSVTHTLQPLTVTVALYDSSGSSQNHLHPHGGGVAFKFIYTIVAGGKVVAQGTIIPAQQAAPDDDLFSATFTPPQEGTMTISISGSYQLVSLDNQTITLSVQSCDQGAVLCFYQQYQGVIIPSGILVLLLLLLLLLYLFWNSQPKVFGALGNIPVAAQRGGGRGRRSRDWIEEESGPFVAILGQHRALLNKVLHRSKITSRELQDYPGIAGHIQLPGKNFELVARKVHDAKTGKKAGMIIRKPTGDSVTILVKNSLNPDGELVPGDGLSLEDGNIININSEDVAKFSS